MGFKHQNSPVPGLPCEQTPRQPTPGQNGTQWLEDFFCHKQAKFHLISTFESSELTLPPFVEPSRTNEPPIPGWSPSSKPHEDILTCDPEPEVAPMQSMGNLLVSPNFSSPVVQPSPACPMSPPSVLIIDDTPVGSPLHPLLPQFLPPRAQPPPPLIPRMRLARNSLTCDQQ
ncbi:hypothetical protein O181_038895 [Austropuccinia psidii MF-1]|uniref:Uncharacterized protein n=1 Tax=Austropuccinia psidii MF-1 TaxID=1389203 RepID=A0A9Q3HEL1_9BASI|nr:hypothetical protein [Austropuccinia psidii MF-1]